MIFTEPSPACSLLTPTPKAGASSACWALPPYPVPPSRAFRELLQTTYADMNSKDNSGNKQVAATGQGT